MGPPAVPELRFTVCEAHRDTTESWPDKKKPFFSYFSVSSSSRAL